MKYPDMLLVICCLVSTMACQPGSDQMNDGDALVIRDSVVCYSLFNQPLKYPVETQSSYAYKDSLLKVAAQDYEADPRDLDNIIWYGRRLAYLSEYPKAMQVYTRGLHLHPDSPELYRHRGHRYITMRRFDEAVSDLEKAAELARGRDLEIEPDGIPNKLNIPLSSLQFNIWYHLGLAYYLNGNYTSARKAYDSCMVYSVNDDLLSATTEWYYLTAMRMGDSSYAETLLAPINDKMEIIENDAYRDLLLLYKGELGPWDIIPKDTSDVENDHAYSTAGYGVANYFSHQGQAAMSETIMTRILESDAWASFGYIAAESDKANLR